jgi:hypothetical protein
MPILVSPEFIAPLSAPKAIEEYKQIKLMTTKEKNLLRISPPFENNKPPTTLIKKPLFSKHLSAYSIIDEGITIFLQNNL